MDINRFTQKAQEAVSAAQTKAVRYGHQQMDVEHCLRRCSNRRAGWRLLFSTRPKSTLTA